MKTVSVLNEVKVTLNVATQIHKKQLQLLKKRRQMKARNTGSTTMLAKIKRLNKEFQIQARKDKERAINNTCMELEKDSTLGRTRNRFKKVKAISGEYRARVGTL